MDWCVQVFNNPKLQRVVVKPWPRDQKLLLTLHVINSQLSVNHTLLIYTPLGSLVHDLHLSYSAFKDLNRCCSACVLLCSVAV